MEVGGAGAEYLSRMADFLYAVFVDIETLRNREQSADFEAPKNVN